MINLKKLQSITNTMKVFYVEDDENARESTLVMLEDLFDNIIIATDGKDGLEKFQNNNIDLIITDISMPYMNGLEMCEKIRDIDDNIYIIG